jgi:predicted GNAT family acetyltransferase
MQVEHDQAGNRFIARLESGEAELGYRQGGDRVLDLVHTFVPPESRGRGIGDALVREAFDHAREGGYRVIPTCPFVRSWVERHPEAGEVVEGS